MSLEYFGKSLPNNRIIFCVRETVKKIKIVLTASPIILEVKVHVKYRCT